MFADITEWDGSVHTVEVSAAPVRTERIITYCDGVAHLVSDLCLMRELDSRPHMFGWSDGVTYHHYPFHHVAGCDCARKRRGE
jgi:hypothetical protein